jgi:hypothetical protein
MASLDHATVAADDKTDDVLAPNVWIRNARRTRTFAALAYLNAAGWVAIAADVVGKPQFTKDTADLVVTLVFLLGVATLSAIAGRRIARCGLWLSREAVTVNGPLRSWTLALDEVEGFEPGVRGPRNGTPCPVLKRTDGRSLGVWALGREGLVTSYRAYLQQMKPLCDELDELVRTLRSPATS